MPTHMRHTFGLDELQDIRLREPFPFTKGCRTMKIKSGAWSDESQLRTTLFDIDKDPGQKEPLQDPAAEAAMTQLLVKCMKENDAPPEQFVRLGLE